MTKSKPTALVQAVLLSTLILTTSAQAAIFLPQDPRAMGMGGAVVSIANSSQAVYYNPSLLHNARDDEDFNFEIDTALRVTDSKQLVGALDNFGGQNLIQGYTNNFELFNTSLNESFTNMEAFDAALTAYKDNPINPILLTDLQAAQTALSTSLTALGSSSTGLGQTTASLNSALESVSGKPLTGDLFVGGSVSVPNMKNISWGFFVSAWTTLSFRAQYAKEDGDTINGVSNSLIEVGNTVNTINNTISGDATNSDSVQIETQLDNLRSSLNFFTEDADGDGQPDNNLTTGLKSSLIASGGIIREFGVSLATDYAINGYEFDVGITPKYVIVDATDYAVTLNDDISGEDAKFDVSDIKTYSSFNADIGISKMLTENWKTGLVVKNLIPRSYKTPSRDSKIKISPAVRVGASYQNKWVSLAADLDLTENEAIGGLIKSRFLSLGAEADVWLLKLRAGYRADLSTGNAIPSIGFGLYLVGLNIDAALAANSFELPTTEEGFKKFDDISAALRIGVQW